MSSDVSTSVFISFIGESAFISTFNCGRVTCEKRVLATRRGQHVPGNRLAFHRLLYYNPPYVCLSHHSALYPQRIVSDKRFAGNTTVVFCNAKDSGSARDDFWADSVWQRPFQDSDISVIPSSSSAAQKWGNASCDMASNLTKLQESSKALHVHMCNRSV